MRAYWHESRQTLWLAFPFIINQILQMSVLTVDSLMAGADSELTLAAVAQGTILWHVVMLGIIGLLMPMTALIAKSYARNDKHQLRELFQQAVWLALPLGLLGFALMWVVPSLMHLIGVDAQIIPPATDYLRIAAFTIPLLTLFLPVRFLVEGMGRPAVMMWLTATSLPVNIIGNYFSRPLRPVIVRYIRLGVPSAVALLMEVSLFAAVMLLSGRFGVSVAAASQIAFNYISNTYMIPLGISMALATRIGMAMGEDNLSKARRIGISGMALGAGFMVLSVITIILFGREIAMLYNDEVVVIQTAVSLLMVAGVFQIFDGVQVCSAGALRGLEETQAPMRYAAIGYWLLAMPAALLLTFTFGLGAPGLWWGLLIGLSVTSILGARKFLQLTAVT